MEGVREHLSFSPGNGRSTLPWPCDALASTTLLCLLVSWFPVLRGRTQTVMPQYRRAARCAFALHDDGGDPSSSLGTSDCASSSINERSVVAAQAEHSVGLRVLEEPQD